MSNLRSFIRSMVLVAGMSTLGACQTMTGAGLSTSEVTAELTEGGGTAVGCGSSVGVSCKRLLCLSSFLFVLAILHVHLGILLH